MAATSRILAVIVAVMVGAIWGMTVHAEDTGGGAAPAAPANAAASDGAAAKGAKPAKPAPKSGGAAAKSGSAKTGTARKGAKGGVAKAAAGATTTTPAEAVSGPEVRNFQAFCDEWMQKLRDRETYNTSHIAWDTHDGGVSGEYVGYDTKCTCIAREEPGKDPIGKITYRETRYRRAGASESAALAAPATAVEQSDVTEIFRFGKGRWQY